MKNKTKTRLLMVTLVVLVVVLGYMWYNPQVVEVPVEVEVPVMVPVRTQEVRREREYRGPPIKQYKPGHMQQMGILLNAEGETLPLYFVSSGNAPPPPPNRSKQTPFPHGSCQGGVPLWTPTWPTSPSSPLVTPHRMGHALPSCALHPAPLPGPCRPTGRNRRRRLKSQCANCNGDL